jgi:hypothetical protein
VRGSPRCAKEGESNPIERGGWPGRSNVIRLVKVKLSGLVYTVTAARLNYRQAQAGYTEDALKYGGASRTI